MARKTAKKRERTAARKTVELLHSGGEVSLHRDDRWLATFTCGASTVTLRGPLRIFTDATAPRSICHSTWVRILPHPFGGNVDGDWLAAAIGANQEGVADILAIAMQYMRGAPALNEGNMQIAGTAAYGPLAEDGRRLEGSDFNDYLGLAWGSRDRNAKSAAKQIVGIAL